MMWVGMRNVKAVLLSGRRDHFGRCRAKRAAHVKCWRPCSATTKRNRRLEHCCRGAEYTPPNEDVRECDLGKLGRLEERESAGGGKAPAAPPSKMHYCSGWPDGYQDHGLPRGVRGRGGQQEEGAWLHEEEDIGSRLSRHARRARYGA